MQQFLKERSARAILNEAECIDMWFAEIYIFHYFFESL